MLCSYIVTTTADTGEGSLRSAIDSINQKNTNIVEFQIPCKYAQGKRYLIQVYSPLPAIKYPIKINGINSDGRKIVLVGQNVSTCFSLIDQAHCSIISHFIYKDFAVDICLNSVNNVSIKYSRFSATAINQSSIVGTSIENFTASYNTFTTTTTDTNGIFLTNPTGKICIKNNKFTGFSDATSPSFGNGIYILLNNNSTVDTLKVSNSKFNNFSNVGEGLGGNGILIDFEDTGGKIDKCIVDGCSFKNMTPYDTGIFAYLNAANSKINDLIVSNCSLRGFNTPGSSGILAYLGAPNTRINNYIISKSILENFSNGSFGAWVYLADPAAKVKNFIISETEFNNFSGGFAETFDIWALVYEGTINNFIVSDCLFDGLSNIDANATFAILAETDTESATIKNIDVSNNKFKDLSSSPAFVANPSGSIIKTNVSECLFEGISGVDGAAIILAPLGGSQESTNISGCSFNKISNSGIGVWINSLLPGSIFNKVNISDNTFTEISGASQGISTNLSVATVTISDLNITKNTFTGIEDTSNAILLPTAVGIISNMNISGNTFDGPKATQVGYAVTINVGAGDTTCLNFKHNEADPKKNPTPYQFINSGGIFNLTQGSDSSKNIGQIGIGTGVNPPGSCACTS